MALKAYLDRFKSSAVGWQISLVAGLAVILAVIVGLSWVFLVQKPYQPLFNNMRTSDAATIVAELDRQKIPYKLAQGGQTILVPADMLDASRLSILSKDLPLKGAVGFELFNKSDMGLTDFAQKINYQRALQGELARTIMSLDGVDTVRVHLSLGEDRIFRDDRIAPKASIIVRMLDGGDLSPTATTGIQRLVAAAVPQLNVADVVVLDEHGAAVSPLAERDPSLAMAPLAQERRAIEQYYEARVRLAIDRAFPGKSVTIAVWANLGVADRAGASQQATWNPESRAFPLQVVVNGHWTSGPDAQAGIQDVVSDVIHYDAALGDRISFGVQPESEQASNASAVPTPAIRVTPKNPAAPLDESIGNDWKTGAIVGLSLLALILSGVLLRQRRVPGSLSPAQRLEFAESLRDALDHGGRDAAS